MQVAGECFGTNVYQVTSNAGDISLLIGVTFIVGLVQRDLVIAGSFANFLSKSNRAFDIVSNLDQQPLDPPPRQLAMNMDSHSGDNFEDDMDRKLHISIAGKKEEGRAVNLA